MGMDIIEQTVTSGIEPLELVYQQVIGTRFEKCEAYRTQLRINSLELGTLTPKQYQQISLRNIQSERLAAWAIDKLIEEIELLENTTINYDWISVYVPVRMLHRKRLYNRLERFIKSGKIKDSTKIALEFSSDILFGDKETIQNFLKDIKSLGFILILNEFGDEFCPLSRIHKMPFDIVILSSYVNELMADSKTKIVAENIISHAKNFDIRVLIDGINSVSEISDAYDMGCTECIGEVSGEYKRIKEVISQ